MDKHSRQVICPHHHHHQAYDSSTRFLLCVTVMFQNPADGFRADHALGSSGSAKRRRERRLRAMQTVAVALAEKLHHSSRGQKLARAGGERETNYTAAFRKMLPPRDGFCGTLWDICPCLLLMSLCRRWWTSCRTLSISSPHSRLILSRLSKCPRSCPSMSLCARPCALRSWWNSWWKYRRQCLTLRYSGLWNSSSTFQFLVVEEQVLVFMVFSQDSVQKRRLPENAFLSGLRSRSLTLFLVEVFLVHLRLTLQLVMKNAQMSLAKGFFALFPNIKKCEGHFALGVGTASAPQLIHGGGSAGGLRRVGAAQGEARWHDVLLEQTY